MAKEIKTNVMRILDREKRPYQCYFYEHGDEAVDGISVAQRLGQNPDQVFKTLVTKGGRYSSSRGSSSASAATVLLK